MAKDTDSTTTPDAPTAKPKRGRRRHNSPRISISVDRERIADATERKSSHCLIAEAIKAAIPTAKNVSVDLQSIRWSDPEKRLRYTYLTPRPAQVALIEFDRGILPAPFEVRLQRAAQISRNGMWGRKKERPKPRRPDQATTDKTSGNEGRPPTVPAPDAADFPMLGGKKLQKEGGRAVPTVIGGHPPPDTGNMGKVRRFGLRAYLE